LSLPTIRWRVIGRWPVRRDIVIVLIIPFVVVIAAIRRVNRVVSVAVAWGTTFVTVG
jgi:hypothetical protein